MLDFVESRAIGILISFLLGIVAHFLRKLIDQNHEMKTQVTELNVKLEHLIEDAKLIHVHDRDIAVLKSEYYGTGKSKDHSSGSKGKGRSS